MLSSLSTHLHRPEEECLRDLLAAMDWDDIRARRVQGKAAHFIQSMRGKRRKAGSIESFFQQYSLSTAEGISLMCLAEALLRIPDSATASALIRDKVSDTKWLQNSAEGADWMTRATGLGLSVTAASMNSLFSKLGEPVIRQAISKAMQMLGSQFVVGQDIEDAQKTARKLEEKGYSLSYDMLGEGARTAEDAQTYFDAYKKALAVLGGESRTGKPAGLSIKLSALHPRYRFSQEENCIPLMTERLLEVCEIAAAKNVALTVDAEEVERLEISLKIMERVLGAESLSGWNGFGLAVQAYQKRALPLIDHLIGQARTHERQLRIRLVKGAYWDTELKRAQVEGLADYPVYTRKVNTDVSYLSCAQKLLNNRGALFPMFGTHNAHTVAGVLDMAGQNRGGFEFQKLYGMGDGLYDVVQTEELAQVCIYAPVGVYRDLLPYLVRRLLENGANGNFVNKVYDKNIRPEDLAADPVLRAQQNNSKSHTKIPLPVNLFGSTRENSRGVDMTDSAAVSNLLSHMKAGYKPGAYIARPQIGTKTHSNPVPQQITNPANTSEVVGTVHFASPEMVAEAFETAKTGYKRWAGFESYRRADVLDKIADLYEENRAELMMLCVKEAGKTLPDALAEVREAVDFCRYYAAEGRKLFDENGMPLPGPTGERNVYSLHGRGVFVCISPWNFPLAIFTGQIVAALMAGNAVIAKPAEQTPLVAAAAVKLMHKAGVPPETLIYMPGDGRVGEVLVRHEEVAGVAFTGSTVVARAINQGMASREGAIAPLIAETGGQNAFIADSSALAEQVVDDLITSAFGSAGQRCSAARLFFVQDDAADKILTMLKGAMAELRIGDPLDLSTDIGPVIDDEALAMLQKHKTRLQGAGKIVAQAPLNEDLKRSGHFFAPIAYEIDTLDMLRGEIFGPVLHVLRYAAKDIDQVIDSINKMGYGLTFGLHSRIGRFSKDVAARMDVGNVYVNRSTIGAVVGSQPFGGHGLSGTGPKAGGPNYLQRFACEKVVSTNTAAAGGNAALVMLEE